MANQNTSIYKIFWFISCCLWASHVAAVDVLNQGDVLNSSDSLVSRNGFFALKFFNLSSNGDSNTNYSYLGIFYIDDIRIPAKPFWIAYRDGLITDNSEALVIDENGKLMITFNGSKARLELFSGPSNNKVTAILQDDGNFVLKSGEQILWQSFDFPTDSFLPGMKLGQNRPLTSWFTASMPIPGPFTLEWIGRQLVVKRRGVKYWTSGELNNGTFENLELSPFRETVSNFTILNEEYLAFKIFPKGPPFSGLVNETTSLSLEYDGTIVEYTIGGGYMRNRIYDSCNGNNTDSGCEKWKGPKCRSHGEKFQKRVVRYDNSVPNFSDYNESLSLSDCLDICWNNCSCFGTGTNVLVSDGTGTLSADSDTPGCRFWYGPLEEIGNGESDGTVCHMIIPGPPGWKGWIWIVSFVPATFIIISLLGVLVYLRWRKLRLQEKFLLELMTLDNPIEAREIEIDGNNGHNLKVFSVSSIMDATNCFSTINKLGEGGFGPVYKGKLSDGREIAIKRLSRRSGQGLVEFKNELILIAKLQHTNLVRLLGFCIHGEEKMLVYEFMPNKSLDSYIFDQSKRELLDWNKCFNIIEGIAQGLLYLHKYSRLTIIHRDLKAGNILLDQNMNPKISDFGMARIFITPSEANTNRIVGTYGYMAPEYVMGGIFSEKSDVFSFGVLLLEIVSGRKNNSFYHSDPPINLVEYAWQLWKEGAAIQLMHLTLRDSFAEDTVLRCINVALLCVEDNPLDRPSMSIVVSMLTSEIVKLPKPKQPAFCFGRTVEVNATEAIVAENPSINNVTLSDMYGR